MAVALCNFIRMKIPGGSYAGYAYQNFFINQSRSVGGASYSFLPFVVANGGGKKGGDRSSSSLAASPNAISINVFAEAVEGNFLLEVKTHEVDAQTLGIGPMITNEIWSISRMEFDNEKVVLQLVSPLDAVDGQVPRRYLSSKLVGALPSSGRLSFG